MLQKKSKKRDEHSPAAKHAAASVGNILLQRKLSIGEINDPLEHEADAMANKIIRMPESQLLYRKCAHCEKDQVQLKSLNAFIQKKENQNGIRVSDAVQNKIQSTKGSGEYLPDTTRSFMESRFGTDFSHVRIHNGEEAERLSSELNAQAFTVGHDIYFNAGKYQPQSTEGQQLLAHELTHTIQQQKSISIQKKIKVHDPKANTPGSATLKNWEEAQKLIHKLDPAFNVNSSGDVVAASSASCATASAVRDKCLCTLTGSADTWEIIFDNNNWPHTSDSPKSVTIQNSFSKLNFGSWGGGASANTRVMQSGERVLGHELCGHAFLLETGTHPASDPRTSAAFGRPGHAPTVGIENKVADEIAGTNAPDRGVFTDPHQGESFAKISIAKYGTNSFDVMSSPERINVKTIVRFMKDPMIKADIIGHSDGTGTASERNKASGLRAKDLKNTLVLEGISPGQFKEVKGVGDSECAGGAVANPDCRKTDVFMFLFEAASISHP